jgi:outer membrane protein assembly factor BamB
MTNFLVTAVLMFFVSIFSGCSVSPAKNESKLIWSKNFPVSESQSSPRTADLNKDGIFDIVIEAGKNEFQKSDMGIFALDGKSGVLLSKQESVDQVYGSATLYDVTGDQVKDVFVEGRSPQLKAIDRRSGALLWEFKHERYKNDPIMQPNAILH